MQDLWIYINWTPYIWSLAHISTSGVGGNLPTHVFPNYNPTFTSTNWNTYHLRKMLGYWRRRWKVAQNSELIQTPWQITSINWKRNQSSWLQCQLNVQLVCVLCFFFLEIFFFRSKCNLTTWAMKITFKKYRMFQKFVAIFFFLHLNFTDY